MFIAMNRFQVSPGRETEFEEGWRTRESYLKGVSGFAQFILLRGDEPGDYISHTTWVSRDAFLAWAQSEHFRRAHGSGMPEGVIAGHPRAYFYDAVIVERPDDQPAGEPTAALD
ncbi:MAG: antibiotic biosynthesis monooxygenase family protein [Dehalococcoidia bacterium]